MRLEGTRLVVERAVATGLEVAQVDAFDAVAVGTMSFREIVDRPLVGAPTKPDVLLAVKFDLRDDADLARLRLYNSYVVGELNVGVPILRVEGALRVEAELRFDVWRLRSIETTE